MSDSRNFDELATRQMRVGDSVCVAFEKALRGNSPLTIEQFLVRVPDELQGPVFKELLAMEIEWLRSHSLFPDAADYFTRFPERHNEIHGLLRADQTQTFSSERTGQGGDDFFNFSNRTDIPSAGGTIDDRYTIIEAIGHG